MWANSARRAARHGRTLMGQENRAAARGSARLSLQRCNMNGARLQRCCSHRDHVPETGSVCVSAHAQRHRRRQRDLHQANAASPRLATRIFCRQPRFAHPPGGGGMNGLFQSTVFRDLVTFSSTDGADLAQPPVGLQANQTAGWILLGICIAFLPPSIVYAVRISRTEGHFVAPALMLAGGVFAFLEPPFDILGGVWYPSDMPVHVATIFGRVVNLAVICSYLFYFFIATYGAYVLIRQGASLRKLALFAGAFALLDSVLEMGGTELNIFAWYSYSGEPVAAIYNLPIYMIVWNGGYSIFSGVLLFLAMPYLKQGARALLVIPGVVMAYAVTLFLLAAPSIWALNNDVSATVSWTCGVISCVAMIAVIWYVVTLPQIARLRTEAEGSPSAGRARELQTRST